MIFLAFTLVWVLVEVWNFINADKIAQMKHDIRNTPSSVLVETPTKLRDIGVWWLINLVYFAWVIAGLFTSYWLWMIPLIITSLFRRSTPLHLRIDAIISGIYLLIFFWQVKP